jgi:hypothetical protein
MKKISNFVEIKSPWVTIIGEKWQDNKQQIIDYWRVEKADSVIILTLWQNKLIFPLKTYRVGIDQITLDFAGGRVKPNQNPKNAVYDILKKELNLNSSDIKELRLINNTGWAINSSFSNQKLYGFMVEIDQNITPDFSYIGCTYSLTPETIEKLLQDLTCGQCRLILLEWLRQNPDIFSQTNKLLSI